MYVGDDLPHLPRTPRDIQAVRRMVGLLRRGSDARAHKVSAVRSLLQQQTYENDLKLSVALDRMIEEHGWAGG